MDTIILQAGTEAEVKIEGVGAALITTSKENLLDCIDNPGKIQLFEELGHEMLVHHHRNGITLPAGKRRYLKFELPQEEVMDIFRKARILSD